MGLRNSFGCPRNRASLWRRQRVVAFRCLVGGSSRRISRTELLDQVGGHFWCATNGLFSGADAVVCFRALGHEQRTDDGRQCSVPSDSRTTGSSGAQGHGSERVAALALPPATLPCCVVGPACFAAGGPAYHDREDGHAWVAPALPQVAMMTCSFLVVGP